jgi:hypothetical protein
MSPKAAGTVKTMQKINVLLERVKTKNALCYEPKPSGSPHKSITFKGRLSSVCGSVVAGLGFSEYAPAPKHKNTPTPGSGWNFLVAKLRQRQGKSYKGILTYSTVQSPS